MPWPPRERVRAKVVITADEAPRGGASTPLEIQRRSSARNCDDSVKCLGREAHGGRLAWVEGRDFDYNALAQTHLTFAPPKR